MARAVRFDEYGDLDVLQVVEVDRPVPGPGKVLVRVKAAGINPGEASIRKDCSPIAGRRRFLQDRGAISPESWRRPARTLRMSPGVMK